jgi:Bacillus/Clostridium GerA spore germination protein.
MLEQSSKSPLPLSLKETTEWMKQLLGNSCDLIVREFKLGYEGAPRAAMLYTDGLVDLELVQLFIMKPLMELDGPPRASDSPGPGTNGPDGKQEPYIRQLVEQVLPTGGVSEIRERDGYVNAVLTGYAVISIDGYSTAIAVELRGWEERGVDEPSTQTVIRGPREGFSENIRINTALIRRFIKDPKLWIESQTIGRSTRTAVSVAYMKGTASEGVIEEVRRRLSEIDIDAILESSYIEELIQDDFFTPFPTIFHTERPDAVAAGLLEGRVAILIDRTPFVLMVPALFVQFFQSPEDYYQRSDIGSLIRILRFLCFGIAMFVPSIYIAITTFHQEMLPTSLFISLAAQREGVPFPAFIEAMLMEVTFEILREAGIRMPRSVGQAVSIVGTLVIGQAAVEAGIVSAAMVIVVSITAISSFVLPSFNISISVRMLRFLFMLLAASFGIYGIIIAFIALVLHLSRLSSFGVPYLTPFAPLYWSDQKDAIMRWPIWAMRKRPRMIAQSNRIRQRKGGPRG